MKSMIANPLKWFVEGATDVDFIRANEIVASRGRIHAPVSSADILTKFRARANELGLKLVNEQGALLKQKIDKKNGGVVGGDRYMFLADVIDEDHKDYALSVGFRNFGDKSLAFSGMCGTSVFVCENGVCHGIVKPSKIRHTIGNMQTEGLLDSKIDAIFSRFLEDGVKIHKQIETMKGTILTDDIVGKFVKGLVGNPYVGAANVMRILEDLENPERNDHNDNSVMRLMNSASHITSHEIKNPNQSMLASNFCNNLLMRIIDDGFIPLGDVVDVAEEENDNGDIVVIP